MQTSAFNKKRKRTFSEIICFIFVYHSFLNRVIYLLDIVGEDFIFKKMFLNLFSR